MKKFSRLLSKDFIVINNQSATVVEMKKNKCSKKIDFFLKNGGTTYRVKYPILEQNVSSKIKIVIKIVSFVRFR